MESISPKSKGYLVVIGGILTNIIIGNSMHWLSFVSFYLKYYNNEIQFTYEDTQFSNTDIYSQQNVQNNRNIYLILCLVFIFSNMSNALSPFFTKRTNIRTVLFISFFLIICSYSLLYFITNNYSLTIIAFILYGIGIGLPYSACTQNIWKYFQTRRNLISLVNVISYATSAPLFNWICNRMLMSQQPFNNQVKAFIWVCNIVYTLLGVIITVISFDYLQERNEKSNNKDKTKRLLDNSNESEGVVISRTMTHSKNRSLNDQEFNMKHIHHSESNVITIPTSSTKNSKRPSITSMNSLHTTNTNISNMVKGDLMSTEKTIDLLINNSLSLIFGNKNIYFIILYYCFISYMVYAWIMTSSIYPQHYSFEFKKVHENIIPYLIYSISISRFIVPFILSFIGEFKCVIFFGAIQTILAIYMKDIISTMEEIYYYIAIMCVGLLFTGNSMLISNIIYKIYGNDMAFIISGIIIGIGSLMTAVFYFIERFIGDIENLFMIGIFTTVFAVLINVLFVKMDVFDYSKIYKGDKFLHEEQNMNDLKQSQVFETNSVNDVKSE